MVERILEHLVELRELQLHPGRVLRVLHAHTRPERLAPHKHPRLVKTVQPTRVLRVVGATHVVRAPHLEQRNVLVHLRVGGRRGHEGARRRPLAWPLRVVVVPNELQDFLVDSQTCLIDPKRPQAEALDHRAALEAYLN